MARIMRSVATMAMLTFASLAVAESPMRRMQVLKNFKVNLRLHWMGGNAGGMS
jgi:hypothetical protein